VHRFLSITLLLCFGALTPLQGTALRWCLLEHKVVSAGFDTSDREHAVTGSCCDTCAPEAPAGEGDDCCVELEPLRDSTTPVPSERLPGVDWLAAVLSLTESQDWPRPAALDRGAGRLRIPKPVPIGGRLRQAMLNVWTV
jgi:hypothetical protein